MIEKTRPQADRRTTSRMVCIWPRTMICEPRGNSFRPAFDDAVDFAGDAAQVAALHGAVNIDHRLML